MDQNLTNTLINEHKFVVDTLTEVKKLGITTSAAQEKLMSVKKGLLAHLKKEDEKLYPLLLEKAKQDANIKNVVDTFCEDMEGISKAAIDFFNKYQDGGDTMEFAKDFGHLYSVLKDRIFREETILYQEYNKLVE